MSQDETHYSPQPGRAKRHLRTVVAAEIVNPLAIAFQIGDEAWQQRLDAWRTKACRAAEVADGAIIARPLDGLTVAFQEATAALGWALRANDLAAELDLPLRAGVHTGETMIGNGQMTGVAPLLAAMVSRQAKGGEILATQTVRQVANGQEIGFQLVGRQTFLGLPIEWELFRIAKTGTERQAMDAPVEGGNISTVRLSPREMEVARLITDGLANREIADQLGIALATVERHVANMLMKLGFRSRAQIASWMVGHGHYDPASD
jgi:DNA-binding CsgD family transcriptional regulator/class 3 adenylate cyclase